MKLKIDSIEAKKYAGPSLDIRSKPVDEIKYDDMWDTPKEEVEHKEIVNIVPELSPEQETELEKKIRIYDELEEDPTKYIIPEMSLEKLIDVVDFDVKSTSSIDESSVAQAAVKTPPKPKSKKKKFNKPNAYLLIERNRIKRQEKDVAPKRKSIKAETDIGTYKPNSFGMQKIINPLWKDNYKATVESVPNLSKAATKTKPKKNFKDLAEIFSDSDEGQPDEQLDKLKRPPRSPKTEMMFNEDPEFSKLLNMNEEEITTENLNEDGKKGKKTLNAPRRSVLRDKINTTSYKNENMIQAEK